MFSFASLSAANDASQTTVWVMSFWLISFIYLFENETFIMWHVISFFCCFNTTLFVVSCVCAVIDCFYHLLHRFSIKPTILLSSILLFYSELFVFLLMLSFKACLFDDWFENRALSGFILQYCLEACAFHSTFHSIVLIHIIKIISRYLYRKKRFSLVCFRFFSRVFVAVWLVQLDPYVDLIAKSQTVEQVI